MNKTKAPQFLRETVKTISTGKVNYVNKYNNILSELGLNGRVLIDYIKFTYGYNKNFRERLLKCCGFEVKYMTEETIDGYTYYTYKQMPNKVSYDILEQKGIYGMILYKNNVMRGENDDNMEIAYSLVNCNDFERVLCYYMIDHKEEIHTTNSISNRLTALRSTGITPKQFLETIINS